MATVSGTKKAVNGIRIGLGVGGALALLAGILILVWPSKSAIVVTAIVAIYAIVAGIVYALIGIFSTTRGGWTRVGHIVLGVLFVFAGAVALSNLAQAKAWLAIFLGVLVGIMWIVEGVAALTTIGDAPSRIWTILFAVLSIVAGITLFLSPMWGVTVLWWLLGVSLVVLGVLNVVRGFTFGSRANR